jgi:hypothetical protein
MKRHLIIFTVLWFLSFAESASAASLIVSSSGNGVFTLQGVGLADVAGIDVTIGYDTSTLSSPRVVQGGLISGAMMAANPNIPGVIRIAVVKTGSIAGSGVIASINFSTVAGSEGRILALTARMINGQGAQLGVKTQVINPDNAGTASSATDSGSTDTTAVTHTAASSSTSGLGMRYLGPTGVSLPSVSEDDPGRKSSPEHYPDQPVPQSKETSASGTAAESEPERRDNIASPTVVSTEKKYVVYKSVLDCFRDFTGEKSAKAMTQLFDMSHMPGFRQEPAVALTDGKTRVKVFIPLSAAGEDLPNFAVNGAKLISLKIEGSAWAAEVLPDAKTLETTITVLDSGSITRIPLTVAPPLDAKTGKTAYPCDAGLDRFLNDRGSDKAPRFDLNGDGVRNYIDDYICTANYLAKRNSGAVRQDNAKK